MTTINSENIHDLDQFLAKLHQTRELELRRLRERTLVLEKLVKKLENQVTKFTKH